jgi:hypothetical protein
MSVRAKASTGLDGMIESSVSVTVCARPALTYWSTAGVEQGIDVHARARLDTLTTAGRASGGGGDDFE